jgi:ankyrin repeat protein
MSGTGEPTLSRAYAWFNALLGRDYATMDALLAHGTPIDTKHPLRHTTALMEATRLGSTDLVRWLLDHGASQAFLSGHPATTALHMALRRRAFDVAALLANAAEHCAWKDARGATPLHALCNEALSETQHAAAQALATIVMLKQCPLDALDQEGTTALHHCVMHDLQGLAELLLSRGANPNAAIPDSGVTPLIIAALEKNNAMAEILIDFGGDADIATRDGATALALYPMLAGLRERRRSLRQPTPMQPTNLNTAFDSEHARR